MPPRLFVTSLAVGRGRFVGAEAWGAQGRQWVGAAVPGGYDGVSVLPAPTAAPLAEAVMLRGEICSPLGDDQRSPPPGMCCGAGEAAGSSCIPRRPEIGASQGKACQLYQLLLQVGLTGSMAGAPPLLLVSAELLQPPRSGLAGGWGRGLGVPELLSPCASPVPDLLGSAGSGRAALIPLPPEHQRQ